LPLLSVFIKQSNTLENILKYGKFIIASLILSTSTVRGEEGGSGHYLPGSMSSFIDGVPPTKTLIIRLNVIDYAGDYENVLPIAGQTVANIDVKSSGLGLTMVYRPDIDLGEKWSYAFGGTLPLVDLDVKGTVTSFGVDAITVTDNVSGMGDLMIMPIMLNQNINPDVNINYRVSIYAPTGDYTLGNLANISKNFWTVEPTIGFIYFGQKNGIEASLFAGIDFNSKNNDTQYKSGNQAHIEATVAQHFPLWGGLTSAGITGFYYKQITGDSGIGATFGDFKAKATGVGPTISYIGKLNGLDIMTELKWLHELDTKKRVQGDTLFLKAVVKF